MFSRVFDFIGDRSGNFAIATVMIAVPLFLAVGLSVDVVKMTSAQRHLQEMADAAVIAATASDEIVDAKLREIVERYSISNTSDGRIRDVHIADLSQSETQVKLRLGGTIDFSFMHLIGKRGQRVEAFAAAERAIGDVELALVLDNTWSMSELNPSGVSKITALKRAANLLVDEVKRDKRSKVRISVVPYADYVNVGTKHRRASWLDVADDYSVDPTARTCETRTTKSTCVVRSPSYSCTKVIDGVSEFCYLRRRLYKLQN